jgi:ubiquinone/menaquinone biosynthesis C-methylase UbiE
VTDADHDRHGVRRTYDRIAEGFAATRATPWPEVTEFLADRSGRVGLDIGCGNGRHLEPLADRVDHAFGLDASTELLGLARERAADHGYDGTLLAGDAARLPLRDGAVDLAVYVATLHHLPSRAGRVESLSELSRVLAPGGRALVSAWSTEHDRFDDHATDEGFDTTIDWTLPDGTVPRYYHIYAPDEFDADLARSDLAVERSFRSSGNCYAVVGGGSASAGD